MSTDPDDPHTRDLTQTAHGVVAPSTAAPSRPHRIFTGERYKDLGRIAHGGTAEVRRVLDTVLGETLVQKILFPQLAHHPTERDRFLREAQITARLRHPGVVAVQEYGETEDGRPWYTMTEVVGETLDQVERLKPGMRRGVELILQVARTLAYAHQQGIVHRDLKPQNIMVGAFGEVRVMDWGLARIERLSPLDTLLDGDRTASGTVAGTPKWMAPEQAHGHAHAIGPHTDVYALGALLYWWLGGKPPYSGSEPLQILNAIRQGPPPALPPTYPDELLKAVQAAMRREHEARCTTEAFVERLEAWLDGSRRRAEALRLVEEADQLRPRVASLRQRARDFVLEARTRLENVPTYAAVEHKREGWHLEDQAGQVNREAAVLEATWLQTLYAALVQAPDLPEVRHRLAEYHARRLLDAEASGRVEEAAAELEQLRRYDQGKHTEFITGRAAVTLHTDPAGCTVNLLRYHVHDRRLVPRFERCLGLSPLLEVPIEHGSWLLELVQHGRTVVRYPIYVSRGDHWHGIPPGETHPQPVYLPTPEEIPEGMVYVPAGWFEAGQDPDAIEPLENGGLWVPGFFMAQNPITEGEYLAFLNDLPYEEAAQWVPRQPTAAAADPSPTVRWEQGRWKQAAQVSARMPIVGLSHADIERFLQWESLRRGHAVRLPHGIEWEKACRGVDRRPFAMGWFLDPSWCAIAEGFQGTPDRVSVDAYPLDVSVYGCRGMTGNVNDRCANAWDSPLGAPLRAASENTIVEVRGGSSVGGLRFARAANRLITRPQARPRPVGFRLCADLR